MKTTTKADNHKLALRITRDPISRLSRRSPSRLRRVIEHALRLREEICRGGATSKTVEPLGGL